MPPLSSSGLYQRVMAETWYEKKTKYVRKEEEEQKKCNTS